MYLILRRAPKNRVKEVIDGIATRLGGENVTVKEGGETARHAAGGRERVFMIQRM